MKETKIHPVFLAGHRKSGTTMFLNLLDSHPELCVYPVDITVLYAYFPLFESSSYAPEERKKRVEKVVFKHLQKQEVITKQLDVVKFRKAFGARMEGKDYKTKDVIENLMLSYQEVQGINPKAVKGSVIKETSVEIYAGEIFEWFPEAKFVHLIRDPRDNFAALKSGIDKLYKGYGDDAKTILHSLLERAHLGMKMADINVRRFGKERYKILRFEDLVAHPLKTLKGLCDFLEIGYNESLVTPTLLGQPTRGNNFEKMDFSKISGKNIGRWKERIDLREAMVIEFHFKELMERFDYKFCFSEAEQADAAADFYKWSNYKYHYFDAFK